MAKAWGVEELQASVQAYLAMLASETASRPYEKKQVYAELAKKFQRTEKAFEYRMQNISHVLDAMGRRWIKGLKPAKNVGSGIASVIEHQILVQEGQEPSMATLRFPKGNPTTDFDRTKDGSLNWPYVNGIDEKDLGFLQEETESWEKQAGFGKHSAPISKQSASAGEPLGVANPQETSNLRREFARDSAVVSWVLARSSGRCECCSKPAPFVSSDGTPFLEVHHLRYLANKGTDRVSNAVAVCPNCHRELHFGSKSETLLQRIYKRVPGLKVE